MKERLYDIVGVKIKYATISTFHALCAKILRQDIEPLGYKKNFEIIDITSKINEEIDIDEGIVNIFSRHSTSAIVVNENENIDERYSKLKAQKNLINLATYITMFPQLIAGPIVRYSDIVGSLTERKISFEKISTGLRRFIIGLSKKVLLANALGELCVTFKASDDKSLLFYWLYAIAFCLQVYFDFSGYSDMAIGLGKMLGFHYLENNKERLTFLLEESIKGEN